MIVDNIMQKRVYDGDEQESNAVWNPINPISQDFNTNGKEVFMSVT